MGQASFEQQYQKPMREKSPEHLDKLFLKGVTGPAPSRIVSDKNFSALKGIMDEDTPYKIANVYDNM